MTFQLLTSDFGTRTAGMRQSESSHLLMYSSATHSSVKRVCPIFSLDVVGPLECTFRRWQVCACSWGKLRGSLTVAVPAHACVVNASADYRGAFVLVERGGCNFSTKAKHMQRAGCAAALQNSDTPCTSQVCLG